jgi:hypothetical protein
MEVQVTGTLAEGQPLGAHSVDQYGGIDETDVDCQVSGVSPIVRAPTSPTKIVCVDKQGGHPTSTLLSKIGGDNLFGYDKQSGELNVYLGGDSDYVAIPDGRGVAVKSSPLTLTDNGFAPSFYSCYVE